MHAYTNTHTHTHTHTHTQVHEIEGCQLPDSHARIVHTGRALLLIRYMGWFWGHFCPDLLHRLAFALHFLEGEREGET